VSLAVLAASVRADFVLTNLAQPPIESERPLFYDALSDTWRFHISCPVSSEASLIIPQLCLPEDVDQCRQESFSFLQQLLTKGLRVIYTYTCSSRFSIDVVASAPDDPCICRW